ncbi:hypothetical protein CMK11_11950 [Candidatus Poribacteria bacterium]|nr:hypothetical protein [Candidatus Poribacteria bacterium]
MRDAGERPLTETLCGCLARQTTLLTIDNCERVIEAAAELIGTLLHARSGVTVLVTSREPLAIMGGSPVADRP